MRPSRGQLGLFLSLFCASLLQGADPEPGKYKLLVARGLDTDLVVCILKLEQSGDAWTATMVGRNTALGRVTVGDAKMVEGFLRIAMNISDEDVQFEGAVSKDRKSVVGSCGNDQRLVVASLVQTDEEVVVRERMNVPRDLPPLLKELVRLEIERAKLQELLNKSAINDDRTRVANELDDVRKKISQERPKVFAKLLTEFADHPAACEAGIGLLRDCCCDESAAGDLQSWTNATLTCAARLGPRYRRRVLLSALDYIAQNPKATALALELAERIDRELLGTETPAIQSRILTAWVELLRSAGQADKATEIAERLAKIESKLDDEYRGRLPKISVTPFGKRKDKANCVALFEMFIGAEGQSGVAAGLAFDKLFESFRPVEAIAIQYHLHAPMPDALANTLCEQRFEYYAQKYPRDTDVVPASFVNGRPCGCGGGKLYEARDKLKEYCYGITPLVNAETPVKLSAKAKRTGDQVEVEVKAEGIPSDSRERKMRLRMALVEDQVRYPGGNGLRFHRNVVRTMPGGTKGIELTTDSVTKKETINLSDLRKSLTKELNKLSANGTPLPGPYRPMEFKTLKLVAWVQSDADRAIWQAVQADVNLALP